MRVEISANVDCLTYDEERHPGTISRLSFRKKSESIIEIYHDSEWHEYYVEDLAGVISCFANKKMI